MEQILDFWFGANRLDHRSGLWWKGKLTSDTLRLDSLDQADQYISQQWKGLLDQFDQRGLPDDHPWLRSLEGKMALVILFDQLARNIYRGQPKSFYFTDQFGVALAKDILDQAKTSEIPYTYRLFCYITLMHTENILNVVEAHLGLINMARTHPDELIANKIKSLANECKKHYLILNKYGRYPHRNQILGRQSQPEEIVYLNSKSLPSWVKSVKNYQPQMKKKPLKIMVLHSNLQSGDTFRQKTKSKLENQLGQIAELVYVTAPHPRKEANFAWWRATDQAETMVYTGLTDSVKYINHLFNLDQFDGIIGFSQGGTLAGIIANLLADKNILVRHINLKFVVIISGFYCRDVRQQFCRGIKWDGLHSDSQVTVEDDRIKIPSYHVWGDKDILVDPWRSVKLARMFAQKQIYIHDGGHFVPNKWPVLEIKKWLYNFVSDDQFSLKKIIVDDQLNMDQINKIKPQFFDQLMLEVISTQMTDVIMKMAECLYGDLNKFFESLNQNSWKELLEADTRSFQVNRHSEFRPVLVEKLTEQLITDYQSSNPSLLALVAPKKNQTFKKTGIFYQLARRIGENINIFSGQLTGIPNLDSHKTLAIQYKRLIKSIVDKLKSEQDQDPQVKEMNFSDSIAEDLKQPVSDHVLYPKAVPLDIAPVEQLKELHDFLQQEKIKEIGSDLTFDSGYLFKQPARLDLCKRAIGPSGIDPLIGSLKSDSSRDHPLIEHLLLGNNLCGNNLGHKVADFIKSGKSKLKTWYIAGNDLDYRGLEPICQALIGDTLVEQLWLKRNQVHFSGAKVLANMLANNNHLQVLDVANTGLLDQAASVLIEALPKNLKVLYLSSNGLTAQTCQVMAENKEKFTDLEHLGMDCNRLTDDGMIDLAKVLERPECGLKVLGLESCAIGPKGAIVLAKGLQTNHQLLSLRLGLAKATRDLNEVPNRVESEGATAIAELLRVNSVLRKIDLTHNNIKQEGITPLAEVMSYHNRNLIYLNLEQYGVPYNELCRESINISLKRNRLMIDREKQKEIDYYLEPPHIKEILSISRIAEDL